MVLPNNIFSVQDLTALILEIHEYSRWLSHNSIKKRVNADYTSEPPILSPAAMDMIREASGKKELVQSDLDDLIHDLEKFKKSARTITITLAAPPTGDIKKSLVSWCRQNISPNILVSFQFNATLLGGMVVRSGSHIFDWSFRRQILASRDKFPEVLRNV